MVVVCIVSKYYQFETILFGFLQYERLCLRNAIIKIQTQKL